MRVTYSYHFYPRPEGRSYFAVSRKLLGISHTVCQVRDEQDAQLLMELLRDLDQSE
jgi:hypothetical protein